MNNVLYLSCLSSALGSLGIAAVAPWRWARACFYVLSLAICAVPLSAGAEGINRHEQVYRMQTVTEHGFCYAQAEHARFYANLRDYGQTRAQTIAIIDQRIKLAGGGFETTRALLVDTVDRVRGRWADRAPADVYQFEAVLCLGALQ